MENLCIALDIGAGQGVKMGLFCGPHNQIAGGVFPRSQFGDDYEHFVQHLLAAVHQLLAENALAMSQVQGIGVATPGLLCSDGSYRLAVNLTYLDDHNLPATLSAATGKPVGIDNDANLGGLAEWSVLRTELLYWVFGGGWGGVWIDAPGTVRFPSLDWNRVDASLHPTNEPGYSIGLDKLMLRTLFYQFGVSYERFEQLLIDELAPANGRLTGPDGQEDTIRAEVILSGPGRCRLFRAVVGDDDFYQRFLDLEETQQMQDLAVAGQHISKLSNLRVEPAVTTDRLFGRILARAAHTLIRRARQDGLPEGVPICLGGKPSYALPYFGPSAQARLGAMGIMSYMRPSIIDERGLNANLVGAAVLAEQIGGQRS